MPDVAMHEHVGEEPEMLRHMLHEIMYARHLARLESEGIHETGRGMQKEMGFKNKIDQGVNGNQAYRHILKSHPFEMVHIPNWHKQHG
jgi:hypothetical protein